MLLAMIFGIIGWWCIGRSAAAACGMGMTCPMHDRLSTHPVSIQHLHECSVSTMLSQSKCDITYCRLNGLLAFP